MPLKHSENCKECKKRIFELLSRIFGEVELSYDLNLPTDPNAFQGNPFYRDLRTILKALQNHRGHQNFVGVKKLPRVDFFVKRPGFIVETDESQHFTMPRKIALENYPDTLKLGFDKERWMELCETLNRHDNDPNPYRDETRAWYETLRDFAPAFLNLKPTVRIYLKDYTWCSLHLKESED